MPSSQMATDQLIVHELPAAPKFIGRDAELSRLKSFWAESGKIASLIGLGGAGKTALADQFLKWCLQEDPPQQVIVWSFYDDPDANAFLETLYRFVSGSEPSEAKGSGWFTLLQDYLSGPSRILIFLDGLERIQRQTTNATGIFGELEDPLLRGLLVRIATGSGGAKAIITSRFPVATLEPYLDRGYQVVDVEQLPLPAAIELLESRGIRCDEELSTAITGQYGSHALTLDLLAGAVAEFYEGDFAKLPKADPLEDPSARLTFALRLFEDNLPSIDRDLLSRLCVFRFGVDAETLKRVFLTGKSEEIAGSLSNHSGVDLAECLNRLLARHLIYKETNLRFTVHPAVRDHFYRLFRDASEVHGAIAEDIGILANRPGIGLPSDKHSLDLLEELIFHAIQARSIDEAIEIYFNRLGGNEHLNNTLGEYSRTHRILAAFPECPDPSAMYHCERSFGNFEAALTWRPQNRYILMLSGGLMELSKDPSEATSQMASSLMGRQVPIPERSSDFPICSAMAYLFRGDFTLGKRAADLELSMSIFEDDKVRNLCLLADFQREDGRLQESKRCLDSASEWILQSSSQEHLFLLQWVRARIAFAEGKLDMAAAAIAEGLAVAQESRFRLAECLFLILQAEILLRSDSHSASAVIDDAVRLAIECQFDYGIKECRHLEEKVRRKLLA
jgi:hypothetical protein